MIVNFKLVHVVLRHLPHFSMRMPDASAVHSCTRETHHKSNVIYGFGRFTLDKVVHRCVALASPCTRLWYSAEFSHPCPMSQLAMAVSNWWTGIWN